MVEAEGEVAWGGGSIRDEASHVAAREWVRGGARAQLNKLRASSNLRRSQDRRSLNDEGALGVVVVTL